MSPKDGSLTFLRYVKKVFQNQQKCFSNSCFLFPGQGAQYVGMCKSFLTRSQTVKLFEDAQKILGYDLLSLCLNGPAVELNKTEKCQPAMVVSSLAAIHYHRANVCKALQEMLIEPCSPIIAAGFSVGELSALMFAGALSFEDGLKVVNVRAQSMQQASEKCPSGMVSIVGCANTNILSLCDAAKDFSLSKGTKEPVACIANYLFPGGWVLGGDRSSVDYILEYGKVKHALRRTHLLPVSGAFHTRLMKSAQEAVRQILDTIKVQPPKFPVYSGTSCQPFTSPDEIKSLLVQQIVEPVNWSETVKNMFKDRTGSECDVYEAGPGQQLRAMISRIDRTLLAKYSHLET